MMLQCTKCNKYDPSVSFNTDIFDVDKSLKCKHCKSTSQSKTWKCQCGVSSHKCDKHKWNTKINQHNIKKPLQNIIDNDNHHNSDVGKASSSIDPNHKDNENNDNGIKIAGSKHKRVESRPPHGKVDYQQMLIEDQHNEEIRAQKKSKTGPKDDIILGDAKPGVKRKLVLGPILAARFNMPCTSDGTQTIPITEGGNDQASNHMEGRVKKPRRDGVFHQVSSGCSLPSGVSSSSSCR